MRYIYAVIMASSAVISLYLSSRIIYNQNHKRALNRVFTCTAFSSSLWSIGYAGMFFTDNEDAFVIYRALGMIGLILFLITCQHMLFQIAGYKVKSFGIITFEAISGAVILALAINPGCIIMHHTDKGIVTEFVNPKLSLVYTLYTVAVAICFTVIIIRIIKTSTKKRVRAFGKRLLAVECIVIAGMIVDTVLPAFGLNLNIPASTILQFVGLELIYYAVHKMNRNRISIQNMAGYIYGSMKTPVLIFNGEDKLEVYNQKASEIFDLSSIDSDSINFWSDILQVETPNMLEDTHDTITLDCVYEKKSMYCKIYIDCIHDDYDDYLGYIVTINDVTNTVMSMNELEKAKNEAQSANKAKSLFLANMSHEIRTPMNSILGFSELALKENLGPSAQEYFEDIHNSASILLATINDILDISKIESGKMELVCDAYYPSRMLKDVALIIGMQASKKDLEFEMNVSPTFPSKLYGDKPKLREILINILNNSVKYTNEGKVSLKAEYISGDDDLGTMRFEISDTGIGIKEDEIDTIFNIFQRVDLNANKNTEGTGLGLSITKGFVEMMGGDIRIESTYGVGTTFIVTIPQKVLDSTPLTLDDNNKSKEKSKLLFRDLQILAVDDNRVNLKVICKSMSMYGVEIDTASSGPEAIEMCKEKSYDIVFMDQMMPEMDGVEAMKIIRNLGLGYEAGGKNKIIALTANAIAGTRDILVNEGFDDYLGKPINFGIMEQVLTKLLPEDKYYYQE